MATGDCGENAAVAPCPTGLDGLYRAGTTTTMEGKMENDEGMRMFRDFAMERARLAGRWPLDEADRMLASFWDDAIRDFQAENPKVSSLRFGWGDRISFSLIRESVERGIRLRLLRRRLDERVPSPCGAAAVDRALGTQRGDE